MRGTIAFLAIPLLGLCTACDENSRLQAILEDWTGKELLFPQDATFLSVLDTVHVDVNSFSLKVVSYTNSAGCTSCRLRLDEWAGFGRLLDSISNGRVAVFKFVSPKTQNEVLYQLMASDYSFPVCIDMRNDFDNMCHLPQDDNLSCFLLDENNRVVLIGNPLNSSRVKTLYVETICAVLGVGDDSISHNRDVFSNWGAFDWRNEQTQSIVVENQAGTTWHIDSLHTSCECTSATIDKTDIAPNDSAHVQIVYKADAPSHFMREVYLDINGNRSQVVIVIEGDAIE